MILKDLRIVLEDKEIPCGYIVFNSGLIEKIGEGECPYEEAVSKKGMICMPGFIDIHVHGSKGIDFMDTEEKDYPIIADSLFEEGVTTFLATTMTADNASLMRVCKTIKNVMGKIPSLGGLHLEGPYVSLKYKGAQNPAYIRDPDINEFKALQEASGNNIRYIALAPEKRGAQEFIKSISSDKVHVSAGHTDATFQDIEKAIENGLDHVTHTHNAQSGHHHRHPGVVTAALYFDELYCEFICDGIHICPEVIKTFVKCIGPERFIAITDAHNVKHTDIKEFKLFGIDCIVRPDAVYLKEGPLAGSLLTMDKALRNLHDFTGETLVNLAKMTSTNASRSLGFSDRGQIKEGLLADVVLLDESLQLQEVYKLGERVK